MSRWNEASGVQRGDEYDVRWAEMERAGENPHGEADFICRYEPKSVLDAGCGTGRVAIELSRRGLDVAGVDLDPAMLDTARAKAPDVSWALADLTTVDLGRTFDLVAMPGNVMIFLAPGTEEAVVANLARHLVTDGVLIAGFQVSADRLGLDRYDSACASVGMDLADRYSTWYGERYDGGDYAVSVHARRAD